MNDNDMSDKPGTARMAAAVAEKAAVPIVLILTVVQMLLQDALALCPQPAPTQQARRLRRKVRRDRDEVKAEIRKQAVANGATGTEAEAIAEATASHLEEASLEELTEVIKEARK